MRALLSVRRPRRASSAGRPALAAALLASVLVGGAHARARQEPERERVLVRVVSGSSQAGGASWSEALGEVLARERPALRVERLGEPSDTLLGTLARLLEQREQLAGTLVVLEPGLVECVPSPRRGRLAPRVALPLFVAALDRLARELEGAGAELVLVTPPALTWTPALRERFRRGPLDTSDAWGLDALLRPYAEAVRVVARAHGLALVDLHWHVRQARRAHALEPDAWVEGAGRWSALGARAAAELVAIGVATRSSGPAPAGTSLPWLELDEEGWIEIDRRAAESLLAASGARVRRVEGAAEELLASYALAPSAAGASWPLQLVRSLDGGRTWGRRLATPANWRAASGPARLLAVQGEAANAPPGLLLLASGGTRPALARSSDGGARWTPLEPFRPPASVFAAVDAPSALARAGDGALEAFGAGTLPDGSSRPWRARSRDGGASWSAPEALCLGAGPALAAPALIAPPGWPTRALLCAERDGADAGARAWLLVEGADGAWSSPRALPGALAGEAHVAFAWPDGRVALALRDGAAGSATRGDWILWLGSFDELLGGREGRLRVLLAREHEPRTPARGSLARCDDGTLVALRAGRWSADAPPFAVARRLALDALEEELARER